MKKRIVISGYYGSKNAGDEAMLAAMLEVLEDLAPELHITVISADPPATEERHDVEAVSWLDGKGIFSALRHADLLISGGGSLLQNVTSRKSLYYYLAIIFLAHILGKPVMLYAQGIGPILGGLAAFVTRFILNRVDEITVRDPGSLDELARLGIRRPAIRQTADPVLAIQPVGREKGRQILDRHHVTEGRPLVGISVRDWQEETQFKEAMAEAADEVIRAFDAAVVFLPMKYPEDIEAAESIAARMKERERTTVLDEEYTTEEFLSLTGNMDFVIAIRLHALIFASVMGVPMLGISYDPKVDRFLETVGEATVGALSSVTKEEIVVGVRKKWGKEETAAFSKELREKAVENARIALRLLSR